GLLDLLPVLPPGHPARPGDPVYRRRTGAPHVLRRPLVAHRPGRRRGPTRPRHDLPGATRPPGPPRAPRPLDAALVAVRVRDRRRRRLGAVPSLSAVLRRG